MSIYIIKKSGHYYLLEKINGKFINQISTGISCLKNSKRIPKEVEEKKEEYIRNKEKLVKLKSKVLCSRLKKEYLESCLPPIKTPKTYKGIEACFNEFIRVCGDKYLHEFTNRDIDNFLSYKVNNTSVHTAHRIRRTLRPAFKKAIRWGYLKTNPWTDSLKINIPEPDPKYFTKEEFEKMLNNCCNEVLKDAYTWAVFTGVREAELIKAKPTDVNLQKRIIKVYSTISNPNKDKDSREIEMHKRLIPIFEKYKNQEFLFINPNTNKQFTARALLDGIIRACKKAELKHFTFKDLRSTYAMWLINADAPLKWISQQMGHSSLVITEKHYAKYITKEFKGEIDRLNF